MRYGRLAERYTRLTQNQLSLGSNPRLPTIKNYLTFSKKYGIIYMLKKHKKKNMATSSNGLGYKPLKLGIVGSNPRIVTKGTQEPKSWRLHGTEA